MNKHSVKYSNNNVEIHNVDNFDLEQTLDCGQAFRWNKISDDTWQGVAFNRLLKLSFKNKVITLYNTSIDDYTSLWHNYFDLERDYNKIISIISADEVLKNAAAQNSGIRILQQDPWEALCSFIISQNNNIPRIKGIIERLCQNFGEEIVSGFYTFPSADVLAKLKVENLAEIKSGFRAKYIIDGAQKYSSGQINLEIIKNSDIDTARNELMKIKGVGTKVADCTLLFGFGRIDALPKDVWIKRAISDYFDGSFPECALPYAGIAQQYLFNFIRKEQTKYK